MKEKITEKEKIDSVLAYILLRGILKPVSKTKAYELKLVDRNGVMKKIPETQKEKNALTSLDKLFFKIKRLLGSKISNLYSYNYLKTSDESSSRSVQVKSGADRKAIVMRLKKELDQLVEKYEFDGFNDLLVEMINESIEEYKNAELSN